MSTGVLKLGQWRVCYEVWLSFVSRKEIYGMTSTFENEIYGMMSTFENEVIHYCFLNVWLTFGLTKKNHKKKKANCGYREGDLDMSSGFTNGLVKNKVKDMIILCWSLSILPCNQWKVPAILLFTKRSTLLLEKSRKLTFCIYFS